MISLTMITVLPLRRWAANEPALVSFHVGQIRIDAPALREYRACMNQPTAVERADLDVAERAAPARRNPVVRAAGWASELADQPPLIAICAATALFGLFARNRRLAHAGATMLAAELLATQMKTSVKKRVDRTRPHVVDDGGDYEMRQGSSRESDESSFPSGHTAGAVTVARAFARVYPDHRVAAYGIAAAVALIQIPRSKHYMSDLAAGAVVGIVAELAVDALVGAREDEDASTR
jgi:hypothetical protein